MGIRRTATRAVVAISLLLGAVAVSAPTSARTERIGEPNVVPQNESGNPLHLAMAHNHEKDEFLVVYLNRFGSNNLSGILFDRDGEVISGPNVIAVQTGNGSDPDTLIKNEPPGVAYNPTTDQYVVAFVRSIGSNPGGGQAGHVFAQLVSDTGAAVGDQKVITPDFGSYFFCQARFPDVAFDPSSGGYMFTYFKYSFFKQGPCTDVPEETSDRILLQPASADLVPGTIVPAARGTDQGFPILDVESDPDTGNIMVAAPVDDFEGAAFLYGPDRQLIKDIPLQQPDPDGIFSLAKVAHDPLTGNWLITWRQNRTRETWGTVVDADGDVVTPAAVIAPDHFVAGLSAAGDGTFVGVSSDGDLLHLGPDGQLLSVDPVDEMATNGYNTQSRAAVRVSASSPPRLVAAGVDSGNNDLVVVAADVLPPGSLALPPARLLETRDGPDFTTIDGEFEGGGTRAAGSVLTLQVAGRGGVPDDAVAAHLNIAAAGATQNGFVTAYPCDAPDRPTTSNLNFTAGAAASAAAFVKLSAAGTVCLFVSTDIHLIVDGNGFVPDAGSVTPIVPARLLETRTIAGAVTIDGESEGIGRVGAGSTTELTVAGRGGVDADADAALINITVVAPSAQNFITAYPCGEEQPNSANVNAPAGGLANNLALAKIGDDGTVCLFSSSETDLVVDVSAFVPQRGGLIPTVPARFVDTRPDSETVDGTHQATGPVAADSEPRYTIRGRDQVPENATGVMLNVAAIRPDTGGFITLHPCEERPLAANVNFAAGTVVSNAVFVKLADNGQVCVFSSARTDLTIDVVGYVVDG